MENKENKVNFDIFEAIKSKQATILENNQKIRNEEEREELCKKENHEFEERLYNHFYNTNKGKQWIDIEHIENIQIQDPDTGEIEPIQYDVLIVITGKNSGKTTGILFKVIRRMTNAGKKVFFMRTSKTELEDCLPHIAASDLCPFNFHWKSKSQAILTDKETGEVIGIGKDFKTANRGSGGDFKDYGAIMFDECLSWNANQEIRDSHFFNWAALASSITRNKKDGIKIYCCGNMTHNQGLLNYYGIKPEDKLRYIKRYDINNPDNICRILYINAAGIYKGDVANQGGAVQGMSAEFRHQLSDNTPYITNQLIMQDHTIWENMEYKTGFIVQNQKMETFLFEVKNTLFDRYEADKPQMYMVRVRPYKTHYKLLGKTYTCDTITHNFMNNITLKPDIKCEKFLLYDKAKGKKLLFYDQQSQLLTMTLLKKITPEERLQHGF